MTAQPPVAVRDALAMLSSARLLLGALDLATQAVKDEGTRESLGELTVTIRILVSDSESTLSDFCAQRKPHVSAG